MQHDIIIAYLEVLLSWPPVVAVLGTVVLLLFRKQVGALIERILKIKLPGGGEIVASQPPFHQPATAKLLTWLTRRWRSQPT